MRDLVSAGLVFVALAVVLMIGGGIVSLTSSTVQGVVGENDTLTPDLYTGLSTALTTFTSLLPILALAVVGGIALAYVLGFFTPRK